MIITCNNCNSRFNIDERLIKPQGSKVKCSKCQTVFVVHPPKKEEEIPPVQEVAPLLDDEDSGVDIEKDFVKSDKPASKPVFEEPDVVGGSSITPPAQPTRVPRRVPARSAGASGMQRTERPERPVRSESSEPAENLERMERAERPERAPRPEKPERPERPARPERSEKAVKPTPRRSGAGGAGSKRSVPPADTHVAQRDEVFNEEETYIDDIAAAAPVKGRGKRGKGGSDKPAKKSSGGGALKKLLLLILIIIILLIVAAIALPKAGIQVPFLDKLNISKLLGNSGPTNTGDKPKLPNKGDDAGATATDTTGTINTVDTTPPPSLPLQDTNGILHFYMDPELVNSGILGNTPSGIVIIVEGLLQNNYDEPRKAVKIVGRLYNERYELEQEKIVYAGNLLTEEELVSLNPMEIENRLFTNGREATVQANSTIPFMIVFSNIPEPVTTYTYECELVSSEEAETPGAPITPVSPEPAP